MKPQAIVQVDAFSDKPYSGNPAAVCILEEPRSADWMQSVAMEMNLPETAFLVREGDAYRLRWFTPSVEVDLCGHATLASAHVLWESGQLRNDESALFETRSGRLSAARQDEWIVLDFPAKPGAPAEPPAGLIESLGVKPVAVQRNAFDYLVEVEDAQQVRDLDPDITRLSGVRTRGVIVTAPGDEPGIDFISRFFAPAAGVAEDPVTGSAHCALGPYWAAKLGKNTLTGYQASRRGGFVRVEVKNDRVLLGGKAVTVLRGELLTD
jgi:PhzF family phenazine biosynthesis protein